MHVKDEKSSVFYELSLVGFLYDVITLYMENLLVILVLLVICYLRPEQQLVLIRCVFFTSGK